MPRRCSPYLTVSASSRRRIQNHHRLFDRVIAPAVVQTCGVNAKIPWEGTQIMRRVQISGAVLNPILQRIIEDCCYMGSKSVVLLPGLICNEPAPDADDRDLDSALHP